MKLSPQNYSGKAKTKEWFLNNKPNFILIDRELSKRIIPPPPPPKLKFSHSVTEQSTGQINKKIK